MQRSQEDFSGEFRNIVLVAGANDIGNFGIKKTTEAIAETLGLLSFLNPGANTFACEVGFSNDEFFQCFSHW